MGFPSQVAKKSLAGPMASDRRDALSRRSDNRSSPLTAPLDSGGSVANTRARCVHQFIGTNTFYPDWVTGSQWLPLLELTLRTCSSRAGSCTLWLAARHPLHDRVVAAICQPRLGPDWVPPHPDGVVSVPCYAGQLTSRLAAQIAPTGSVLPPPHGPASVPMPVARTVYSPQGFF